MSSRVRFFDELAEGLPDDTWGRRLQEELDAHLEDAVLFATLEGIPEPDAEREAVVRLGNPKHIIHEFRHAMTYKSLSAFVLHAIAVGLLISPIVYWSTVLMHSFILVPIIFGILYAFYSFGLKPIMRHIEGRALRVQLTLIASLLPIGLIGIPMVTGILGSAVSASDRPWLLLGFFLASSVTIAAALAAVWKPIQTAKNTLVQNISSLLLGIIIFLFTSIGLVGGSQMTFLEKVRFALSSVIGAPNTIVELLSPVAAAWISGLVATGAGMIALVFIVQAINRKRIGEKEPFPWGWMFIAILTLSLVIVPGAAPDIQGITWSNRPHTKISETIERSELGPFYAMAKYLNQGQSNAFNYYVSQEENQPLQVKQFPDRVFSITNLTEINQFDLTETREEINGSAMRTADIWCHWQNPTDGPKITYTSSDLDGIETTTDPTGNKTYLMNSDPLFCSDLWVGDKQIFSASQTIDIRAEDITLSTNGQWMLFAHDTDNMVQGTQSPEEVYLIDLR